MGVVVSFLWWRLAIMERTLWDEEKDGHARSCLLLRSC
jgi:hypothetical protein